MSAMKIISLAAFVSFVIAYALGKFMESGE